MNEFTPLQLPFKKPFDSFKQPPTSQRLMGYQKWRRKHLQVQQTGYYAKLDCDH